MKRGDWGTITFESVKEHITYAIATTSLLAQMPLESLTDQAASELQAPMPGVAGLFARINEFSVEMVNAPATRDQIVNEVKHAVAQMHATYSRWLPYLAYQRGDINRNIDQMEDAIMRANTHLDDAKKHQEENMTAITETRRQMTEIVDAARGDTASQGVDRYIDTFDVEAEKLANESKRWFKGIIGCSVATVVAIVVLYFWLEDYNTTWEIVRNTFTKASIIAVLLNGIVWCTRMYRVKSHQSSVNRHRALSLKTFQRFVTSTTDPRTRDAVLLAATKSIFAHVSTGLVGERANGEDPSIQFMEIGKHAGDNSGA